MGERRESFNYVSACLAETYVDLKNERTDERADGRTDGWMDGRPPDERTDRWRDGLTYGRAYEQTSIRNCSR